MEIILTMAVVLFFLYNIIFLVLLDPRCELGFAKSTQTFFRNIKGIERLLIVGAFSGAFALATLVVGVLTYLFWKGFLLIILGLVVYLLILLLTRFLVSGIFCVISKGKGGSANTDKPKPSKIKNLFQSKTEVSEND